MIINSTVIPSIIFITGNFIYSLVAWMIFVFLPVYLKELAFTDYQIGILIGVFPFVSLLIQLPFGYISDKCSPKRMLQCGIILLAIYLFLLMRTTSFYGLLFSCIIGGSGSSIFLITIYSLYYRSLNDNHRGKKIGSFLFGSYGGFALGPFLAGIIQKYYSMQTVFFTGFVLMLFLFLLFFLITDVGPVRFVFSEYRKDLQKKGVLLLICVFMLIGVHFGAERVAYTLFLNKNLGLSKIKIGQVYLVIGVFLGIFTMICGYVFDKRKETLRLLSFGLLISGFFHVVTVFSKNFSQIILIRLLHTSGDAFMILATNVLVANYFPNRRMGGNYGLVRTIQTVGIFSGAFFCGYLCQLFGYESAFYFSGVLLIVGALYVFTKRHMFSGMIEKETIVDALHMED
ncbi:MFS transporter [Chlamydiota bacterium]